MSNVSSIIIIIVKTFFDAAIFALGQETKLDLNQVVKLC